MCTCADRKLNIKLSLTRLNKGIRRGTSNKPCEIKISSLLERKPVAPFGKVTEMN